MSKENIISILKERKNVLRQRFHIDRIGLFGSYSLDAQTAESDIDLAIQLERDTKLRIKDLYDLELFLKEALDTERVDLANIKYVNPLIEIEMEKSLIYV